MSQWAAIASLIQTLGVTRPVIVFCFTMKSASLMSYSLASSAVVTAAPVKAMGMLVVLLFMKAVRTARTCGTCPGDTLSVGQGSLATYPRPSNGFAHGSVRGIGEVMLKAYL